MQARVIQTQAVPIALFSGASTPAFIFTRKGRLAKDNYIANSLQSFSLRSFEANEDEFKEKDERYCYRFNGAYHYVFCYWLSPACVVKDNGLVFISSLFIRIYVSR